MSASGPEFWIQLGAVGLLAILNILELRSIRPALQGLREVTVGVREVLAALLERERIRSERRREPSSPPPNLPDGAPAFVEPETTDLHSIIERQRVKPMTPPSGLRSARPGTHHDR